MSLLDDALAAPVKRVNARDVEVLKARLELAEAWLQGRVNGKQIAIAMKCSPGHAPGRMIAAIKLGLERGLVDITFKPPRNKEGE